MNSYGPRRVGIRVLCTIFKVVPLAGLFIIFGVICQGISVGVIFWLTKQTLDSTMKFANHQLTFWNGPGYWLILFIVIPTINSVLIQLRIYASSYAEKRIKVSLQEQIYQKVTDIPFHSIEDSKFRDDLQRANFALNPDRLSNHVHHNSSCYWSDYTNIHFYCL